MKKMKIVYGEKSIIQDEVVFINDEDLEFPHGEDYKVAIEQLERIQESKFNNKQIHELFEYKEISLWWFVYQNIISEYKKLINCIIKLEEIIDKYQPEKFEINVSTNFKEIIKNICKKKNISIKDNSKFKINIKNIGKNIIEEKRYKKITTEKISNRKKIFEKYQNDLIIDNKILFAIPSIYRREIYDFQEGRSKKGEYIMEYFLQKFERDFIGIDLDYTFKGNIAVLEDRLKNSQNWFPIEKIFKNNFLENNENTEFLKQISNIFTSKEFLKKFDYNEISLSSSISKILQKLLFAPYIPIYMEIIDSAIKLFSKNKPKAVFLPYETGPYALAIIAVSKKFNIQTIGVQHGYIYKNNPMYVFGKYISEKKNSFPFPEKMIIFGESVKDLLIKKMYPDKKLIVLGNPAFFNWKKISNNKNKILKKFNIPTKNQIILFTTGKLQREYSAHGKYNYDEIIFTKLNELSKRKNITIILKPHPQESNIKIYEEIKNNNNNVIILKNNIVELISISDIIVSVFSSTMIDALCFEKPVLRIKFDDKEIPLFGLNNVIIECEITEIEKYINQFLNDGKFATENRIQIKKFVKNQYGIPEENVEEKLKELLYN